MNGFEVPGVVLGPPVLEGDGEVRDLLDAYAGTYTRGLNESGSPFGKQKSKSATIGGVLPFGYSKSILIVAGAG